jgi:hypothetical protein
LSRFLDLSKKTAKKANLTAIAKQLFISDNTTLYNNKPKKSIKTGDLEEIST